MTIIEKLISLPIQSSIVTIGTFDGLHQGHIHVLQQVVEKSYALNMPSVVITFKQHPANYFSRKPVKVLNTLEEKKELMEKLEIDYLVILPFEEISHMSGEMFITSVLKKNYHMFRLFLGYDNKFGNDKTYNDKKLTELSKTYHFEFTRVGKYFIGDDLISSTLIREKINHGEIEIAKQYLGYPYFVKGKVISGQQLGRKLGFPTANIEIEESYKLLPKNGVYAVKVNFGGLEYGGMCNLGIRPTIIDDAFTFEVHLFDFEQTIYGKHIKVSFIKRLRDEQKFDSLEALSQQIKQDEIAARNILLK